MLRRIIKPISYLTSTQSYKSKKIIRANNETTLNNTLTSPIDNILSG
jgi:hypothetical protein